MMWSELYRPKSIGDMVGNEKARAELVTWLATWKKGTKPALLVGPPGTGKTTIASLLAARFGYDVIEINASDARSKSKINELLGPVMGNVGLAGSILVFVDEVDGIHGRSDFGGASALAQILGEPTVPIILAANSDASDKMRPIVKASTRFRFGKVPPRLLGVYLRDVLSREGTEIGPGTIIKIISESRGDIRAMFNLAQSLAHGSSPSVARTEGSKTPEDAITGFFRAESRDDARRALGSMRGDIREKISGVYSSIVSAKTLDVKRAARMLRAVSDADILHGRIMRTQQWRLLRYIDSTLAGAFEPGLDIPYSRFGISWPLLNRIRWDGKAIKALAEDVGPQLHASTSEFATLHMPYILACIKHKAIAPDMGEEHADIIKKESERIK